MHESKHVLCCFFLCWMRMWMWLYVCTDGKLSVSTCCLSFWKAFIWNWMQLIPAPVPQARPLQQRYMESLGGMESLAWRVGHGADGCRSSWQTKWSSSSSSSCACRHCHMPSCWLHASVACCQPVRPAQGQVHAPQCAPLAILHAVAGEQAQAHAGRLAMHICGGQVPWRQVLPAELAAITGVLVAVLGMLDEPTELAPHMQLQWQVRLMNRHMSNKYMHMHAHAHTLIKLTHTFLSHLCTYSSAHAHVHSNVHTCTLMHTPTHAHTNSHDDTLTLVCLLCSHFGSL